MTTIVKGLIRCARAIGRWLLRRIIARGIDLVIGYMDGKIEDFKRRRKRKRTDAGKRWLAGRIRRWTRALRWLSDKRQQITRRIVETVDREAGGRLADVADGERFASRQRVPRRSRKPRGRRAA